MDGVLATGHGGVDADHVPVGNLVGSGRAYQLVGFTPDRDFRYIEINRALRALYPEVVASAVEQINLIGGRVVQEEATQLLTVNGEFTVSVCIASCLATASGALRWQIRFDTSLSPDVIVALRMDPENTEILDYYILPRANLPAPQVRLGEHNGLALDSFRFGSLDHLYEMAARVSVDDLQ